MDLFFLLPKSVQTGLFHIDEATFLKMKRFIDQIDITRDPIRNGVSYKLQKLSKFCLNLIPGNKYHYFTEISPGPWPSAPSSQTKYVSIWKS
jgi:hypothetical protein